MNPNEIESLAAELSRFVIDNGRVLADADGNTDPESLAVEVEFEAQERGYDAETIKAIVATL